MSVVIVVDGCVCVTLALTADDFFTTCLRIFVSRMEFIRINSLMDTDYRWRQNVFACFDSADSSKQQIAKAYPIVSVRRLNLSF